MVEHIVLFRWTEEASQEAIDHVLAELRALKGKTAGIVDLSGGANFSDRAKGYTHRGFHLSDWIKHRRRVITSE